MIVRSAVSTQIKKSTLFRGTLLACIGMLILIGGSVFLSREQLSVYGFLLFIGGIAFVTWGMIPYRRLSRIENSPREIHVDEKTWSYHVKGKKTMEIPRDSIKSINYFSHPSRYGICLRLKNSQQVFFPYFTERSFHLLKESVHT